jgi:hypothetical protein
MSESKHLKYPTHACGPIPAFHSYEEGAAWWDETDTGTDEIEAVMTPVQVRSTRGYTKQMMLRLDPETDHELEAIAKEQGVKKSTLVRMWVKERLRHDRERHAS